jgi:hypothetical protein
VQSSQIRKVFKADINLSSKIAGERIRFMSEFIWHWTKGNKKIYTRKEKIAENAMKDGLLVIGIKEAPHIFRN